MKEIRSKSDSEFKNYIKKAIAWSDQFVVVQAVEPDVQVGIVDLLVVAGAVAGTHLSIHI